MIISSAIVQVCRNHVLIYEYILLLQISSCICDVGLSEVLTKNVARYISLYLFVCQFIFRPPGPPAANSGGLPPWPALEADHESQKVSSPH